MLYNHGWEYLEQQVGTRLPCSCDRRRPQQYCHWGGGALGLLRKGMIFNIRSSPNPLAGQDSKPGFPKYAGHGMWAVQNTCGRPGQIPPISEVVPSHCCAITHWALQSLLQRPGELPLRRKAGAVGPERPAQRPAKLRRGGMGKCFPSELRWQMGFWC